MAIGERSQKSLAPGSTAWRGAAAGSQVQHQGAQASNYRSSPLNPNSRAPSRGQPATPTPTAGSTSYVPPHLRNGAKVTASTMDETAAGFGAMKIGSQTRHVSWNASNAPAPFRAAPSMMTCHFGASAPGQANSMATIAMNNADRKKWRKNAVCVKSPWNRGTFNKGNVISLPYHVANLDPTRVPEDPILRLSEVGPIVSKRRMVVVLFKFAEVMFCVPLYSFTGRGIMSRRPEVMDQYIQLINVWDDKKKFEGRGMYEALKFKHAHPDGKLDDCTTIHITGGKTVSWQEDIELVGRLTEKSYEHLVTIWHKMNENAANEACDW